MRVVPAVILRVLSVRAPSLGARTTHCLTLTTTLLLLSACGAGDLSKSGSPDADSTPPTIRIVQPLDGARFERDPLTINIEYDDQGSGVAVNSFKVLVNGQDYSGAFDQHNSGASGRISVSQRLTLGENQLMVEVKDRAGNMARAERSFLYAGNGWLTLAGMVRTGGPVTALALSPNGKTLAVGGADGSVRLWDLDGGLLNERATLKGHSRAVTALAFALDGNTLASGGWDRTVQLWDLRSGEVKKRAVLEGHSLKVLALAFAPDGKTLASGGGDRTVRLWDLTADYPTERAVLKGQRRVTSLAFASNGKTLAQGSGDGTVRLLNLRGADVTEQTALAGHTMKVLALAFSPDGKRLITGSADRTIRVWNVSGSKPTEQAVSEALKEAGTTMTFATNGRTLTSAGQDGHLTYWDAASAKSLGDATLPGSIQVVAQAAESPYLVIGYDSGKIYVLHAGISP